MDKWGSVVPLGMEEDEMARCGICKENAAYFMCILCHLPYCNITCYHQHAGKKCLENFLQTMYVTIDEMIAKSKCKKKSVLDEYHDILNELFPRPVLMKTKYSTKLRSLIETIDKMPASTEEEMMKKLTKDELQLYNSVMKNTENKLDAPILKPFWDTEYIQVGPQHRDEVTRLSEILGYKKGCPTYRLDFVPPLATVTPVQPTTITFYNLCHLLAVYSAIVRYYNGEHLDPYAQETSTQLIQICNTFIYSGYYVSKKKAVQDACRRLYLSAFIDIDRITVAEVRADVDRIVRGPNSDDGKFYIICVLGEIYEMFLQSHVTSPERELRKEKFNCTEPVKSASFIPAPSYDALTRSANKIKYYYSYVQSYYSADWYDLP